MKLMGRLVFVICIIFVSPGQAKNSEDVQWGVDRPGSDISSSNLPKADPDLCRKQCANNSKCKAWTYVKPNTIQGPKPRCWLKYAVPKAVKNKNCVSGVKGSTQPPVANPGKMEWNTDRPGSDISDSNLPKADPELCRNRCADNPKCKAWTYVKPNTIQGPKPRCWLKYAVPKAVTNKNCVSGVKGSTKPPVANTGKMEWDTDRPGSDIGISTLSKADPALCRNRCADNPKCKAWTYVKPNTIQGPKPSCWIKNAVPKAKSNSCCVSGVK